jgi:hypothetical protein
MSEITIETLFNQIEMLPASEQRKLLGMLLARLGGAKRPVEPIKFREPIPVPDSEPNDRWLREHSHEYAGQWVALDGDRLIAHGAEARVVFAASRADGSYLPLVTYIEPVDAPAFMGL